MKITEQVQAEQTFEQALRDAAERATISGFDQHIIRNPDGTLWVLDDGDAIATGHPPKQVERTVRGPMHGRY